MYNRRYGDELLYLKTTGDTRKYEIQEKNELAR